MRNLLSIDPALHIEKIDDVLKKPVIIVVNDFEDEDVADFEEDMNEAHNTVQPVIPIVIDTYGGSTYGCNAMISSILNSKKPVATIVKGRAMSAGALLFGFGTEGMRFMDPYATLMIHDAATVTSGKVKDIKADANHLEMINESCYTRLAVHLGHHEDYFSELIAKHKHVDWFLTAKEAKKHRLANHLRIPQFTTHISVEMLFQ